MDNLEQSAEQLNGETQKADPQSAQAYAEDRPLGAGSKLGRYVILGPLGAGGMGVVYRARDAKLERDVAIKIVARSTTMGSEARHRFHKEAQALAKLSHPHIAAIYDVGQQDGDDYIVMECVPGESLAARLKKGPLPVRDATAIAVQIAQALEEAHEQGVVHRDLKPANVMITPRGQAKVLDFGLAKLLEPLATDSTMSVAQTRGLLGTPLYMSPEQAHGKDVDARTDLWSLGVVYYESLTGRPPFLANSSIAVLRAVSDDAYTPVRELRAEVPAGADEIVSRALAKEPSRRYQAAAEMVRVASGLLLQLSGPYPLQEKKKSGPALVAIAVLLLLVAGAGSWLYRSYSRRQWAREVAIPQIGHLREINRSLAAYLLLEEAEKYLPSNPQLKEIADSSTTTVSATSSPAGATVEIQDYATPNAPWHRVGVTPIQNARIPDGYFRWRVSKAGSGEWIVARYSDETMSFPLDSIQNSPEGMVSVPGGSWGNYIAYVGWLGPFHLPAFYIDRFEVTNRDYQKFVDSGGYSKKEFWREKFARDGRELSWDQAMAEFRDSTGRPGPSTWTAGHYPEGQADYPVSGVSWYEASAYAAYAGKSLPVLAQWFEAAQIDSGSYIVPASNISSKSLAAVGTYTGVGPYGTYDMAGNVAEWAANPTDGDQRFILGGSWKSPSYTFASPGALSPFDRSETNGFRCVKNAGPLAANAEGPIHHLERDFAKFKPVSDPVFDAYRVLYDYAKMPLNARDEGLVQETVDWREEKISYDTAYRGERMSAYLFLPKNVKPPYQTVLFFPSARVYDIADSRNGLALGDLQFFNYVLQSGRAVIYPIYEDTYERRVKFSMPGGAQNILLTTDWYKDAARSLDYLATRPDIDNTRLAYLGVSMGSAAGVINATLLQNRLKTAVLLDGGYFLDKPPAGGDQADFAPRMKKPVLMVNGRYDYAFTVDKSQNPLFTMLGTPDRDKRHVLLDTAHDVTDRRALLVKTVLDWLDQYLGRVGE